MESAGRQPATVLEDDVWLAASPAKVWGALTEPGQLTRWFCDEDATVEPRPEGAFVLVWKGGGRLESRFLTFTPEETLSYGFHGGESEPVTFSLREEDGGTALLLSHSIPAGSSVEMLLGITRNWAHLLSALKCWVERRWDVRKREGA